MWVFLFSVFTNFVFVGQTLYAEASQNRALSQTDFQPDTLRENESSDEAKDSIDAMENNLEKWTQKLKKDQESLTEANFSSILEKSVCRPLQQLKPIESVLSGEKLEEFLFEIIRFYGQVLNYSRDHNYFYCICSYFDSSLSEDILNISRRALTDAQYREFLSVLNTCYKQETEGNGDNLLEESYLQGETSLYSNFIWPISSNDNSLSDLVERGYLKDSAASFLTMGKSLLLFQESEKKCLIGGVFKERVYSQSNKGFVCLTRGSTCNDQDTFRCGIIFNEKCIPLYPVKSLSKRCYQASKEDFLDEQKYNNYMKTLHLYYESYCEEREKQGGGSGCKYYRQRVKALDQYFSIQNEQTGVEQIEQILDEVGETACIDCSKNLQLDSKYEKTLFEYREEMIRYFSDVIFDNSSCRCYGNSRCTRGCRRDGVYPEIHCKGEKDRTRPLSYCMRYTNGAIMSTIHAFLGTYCPNKSFQYNLCLDSAENRENTLCDQSFVFPSALCGLGLDGEDRYDLIRNEAVRSKCRQWLRHNKRLTIFKVLEQDGQTLKKIPLFQTIDMPEDPEDLEEGSIIVSKSDSIHGHIEVKTNRRQCGLEGKDICFCSDFCASRKGGYKWPFKPQIVFQWNPEFIHYFGFM